MGVTDIISGRSCAHAHGEGHGGEDGHGLAASERDGKAKDREIHDLKEALCEAKMATAVLAAEVDGLKSGAGGLTTAADLHDSDKSAPASPEPQPAKKGWFAAASRKS